MNKSMTSELDFTVTSLGSCTIDNPIKSALKNGVLPRTIIKENERILHDCSLENYLNCKANNVEPLSFEKAGPLEKIYFDAKKTKVAIVTCGGLCPGLNNVIRSLVFQLTNRYGVNRIVGIKYGYEGFIPKYGHEVIDLTPDLVDTIHTQGGSILGSSRGNQDVTEIVDALERMNINILFTVGGDGTQKGAHAIFEEVNKRGLKISIGGIPKTIDNDISFISKSFGFETAFTIANNILRDAHHEAKGAYNGIAIVKLMGRDSGFIAASAALSLPDANFVLIPELEFDLDGPKGFIKTLQERLERKHHALIVVAEGAGQHLFADQSVTKDASGNELKKDIGTFLRDTIKAEFDKVGFRHSIRYIDPSYIIRSATAIADDSKFCNQLAQHAVHASMAGKTDFVVGNWNGHFTVLPISATVQQRKKIDLEGELWQSVIEATGQPESMKND
jgi:6-phosphofructokinase 1